MKRYMQTIPIVAGLILLPGVSFAGQVSSPIEISMTIVSASCTVDVSSTSEIKNLLSANSGAGKTPPWDNICRRHGKKKGPKTESSGSTYELPVLLLIEDAEAVSTHADAADAAYLENSTGEMAPRTTASIDENSDQNITNITVEY